MVDQLEEPVDFPRIIHRQIWSISQAKNDNDVDKYIRAVENFEDLLIGHIEGDKNYVNDILKSQEKFKKKIHGLRRDNPDHMNKINRARELLSRDAFRALIKLINRAGFLPRKEIHGVISEYDGKLIEKLHKLEKEGKTEISDDEVEALKEEIIEEAVKRKLKRSTKEEEKE